jgi:ATP-dependent helicase/nuclease subunit B
MNRWLDDLALAFEDRPLYLREWLPIVEAGLASLTVGVIPPVLDEVLVGAVDRSRNPDLRLVCIPGFNERVFPALPRRDTLLTEDDRTRIAGMEPGLGEIPSLLVAQEQFYGYIACTRARERLHISCARAGLDGKQWNPSRFIARLQQLFPALKVEPWNYPSRIEELIHSCELPWIGIDPALAEPERQPLAAPDPDESLEPHLVERLFGPELEVSVSAMERFASCPFRFFAERTLNLSERDEFHLDVREQGTFQHEVLARFHVEVSSEGKKWRELSPEEARQKIRRIAEEEIQLFKEGLLLANEQNRFTAANYVAGLEKFIERVIEWFESNQFDPAEVELAFGGGAEIPGWRIPLNNGKVLALRGRVDRIDVYHDERTSLCVVVDYKSGAKEPNKILLHHGIQQQLTAYLLAITRIPELREKLNAKNLTPAGSFLVPLFASADSQKNRRDALAEENARGLSFKHHGVFDFSHLPLLDRNPARPSGQFHTETVFARWRRSASTLSCGGRRSCSAISGIEFTGEKLRPTRSNMAEKPPVKNAKCHLFAGLIRGLRNSTA